MPSDQKTLARNLANAQKWVNEYTNNAAVYGADFAAAELPYWQGIVADTLSAMSRGRVPAAPALPAPIAPAPVRATSHARPESTLDLNAARAQLALQGIIGAEADKRLRVAAAHAKGEEPDIIDLPLEDAKAIVARYMAEMLGMDPDHDEKVAAEKAAKDAADWAAMEADARQTEAEVEAAGGWEKWGEQRRDAKAIDQQVEQYQAAEFRRHKALNPHIPDEQHQALAESHGRDLRKQLETPGQPTASQQLDAVIKANGGSGGLG